MADMGTIVGTPYKTSHSNEISTWELNDLSSAADESTYWTVC
jgi:hypothetical protein